VERATVSSDAEVMGGTPCFAGTRVPVATLLDYLKAGGTLTDFLEGFPTVKRAQVVKFLATATRRMMDDSR
jgi:uncharacterized protein (DUF433 family)